MTDTDDTDDLLLIPPDFFTIKSDSEHSEVTDPYYNIVDNLIKQVGKLQNRIKSIESSDSFHSNSLDYSFGKQFKMHNSVKNFRKYNSSDDLHIPSSNQSTPKKSRIKHQLNSLPNTPYMDRFKMKTSSEYKSPSKTSVLFKKDKTLENISPAKSIKDLQSYNVSSRNTDLANEDNKMLNEIDTFLSKVKTIQRLNAVRNLDHEFNSLSIDNDNNKKVQQVLNDFDEQQRKLENVPSKICLEEPILSKEKIWRLGDTKETVPNLGMGIRDVLYKTNDNETNFGHTLTDHGDHFNIQNQIPHISNQSSIVNDSLTSTDKYPVSDSSTDSTQITAYSKNKFKSSLLDDSINSNALNVLNMHKQVLDDSAEKIGTKNRVREHKPRSTNTLTDNLRLMNLADIWNTSHLSHTNPSQMMQKLQEEKLRRKHCEDLIHELQNRNLELQQRLSVAVRVDDSKNKVISQFQEALEKAVGKIQVIQKEKRDWESEVSKIKNKHKNEMDECLQKIRHYENELPKALNMGQNNQEKINSLEKRCSDLQDEKQTIESKYRESRDMLSKENEKNKQLTEILSEKEIEINENKNTLNNARSEIAKSRKAVEICQEEFSNLKDDCEKLRNDLKYETEQVVFLTDHKKGLQKELENCKRKQVELQDELSKTLKQLENNKIELKNFYQGQVEILVQNKLKEFQAQLNQAETNFKEEIKKRELSIAKTAALHIQQISEKYSLEINLIEKKHQEESKLYQIQIMQYKQQIDCLQTKVDQFQEKRVKVAKQLQKIMETQWSEALRIIANGKSPTFQEDSFSTIDQLNSLKAKSYNNVEEVLIQDEQFNAGRNVENFPVSFPKENENDKYLKDDMETPVSSRTQKNKQYTDHEIQKYINLLLNKQPGGSEGFLKDSEKIENERASWTSEQMDVRFGSKISSKDKKSYKPPWK